MMDGFGVHTFRLINAEGQSTFVKFHWKAVLGAHSLVWDEAMKISGSDPDFHRRTMWESIEKGIFPEWEFGVQLLADADEMKFDFDVLDATKIWPEDLIPVQRVGKLVLNRNPDNYFAETEQVAFNTTNIVPGIDFSHDPLLQGRNFSYLDTQLSRLGSPNFTELPINRPVNPVYNNQREAHMRHTINKGRVSYAPASLDGHSPDEVYRDDGFRTFAQNTNGAKVRERSDSFNDHYGQARLFWNSLTGVEREHIVKALQFELSKVETRHVRVRMVERLEQINEVLARQVAKAIGEEPPHAPKPGGSADVPDEIAALENATSPTSASGGLQKTSGLSQMHDQPQSAKGRKVAIIATKGSDANHMSAVMDALKAAGAQGEVVGTHLGKLDPAHPDALDATKTLGNTASVLFDGMYVLGGADTIKALIAMGDARKFLDEAFKHGKPIAASAEGVDLVNATEFSQTLDTSAKNKHLADLGVLLNDQSADSVGKNLAKALAKHRFTNRTTIGKIAV